MPKSPIEPTGASEPGKIGPDKISEKGTTTPPDTESFQSYKEEAPSAPGVGKTSAEMTPMDLASKTGISTTPTFQSITAQAKNAQDTLGEVQKNLQTPNLKLKTSQTNLLNTKLTNANKNLQTANQKLGAKVPEPTPVPKNANPITKFVGLITDGQNNLQEAQNTLQGMKSRTDLQPGDMLLIQVKLAQAQQEIEYSSVLLSQVVSSLKQILGIQL